ncbi:unnamed protein product, partial [Allacma fusca]
QGGGPGGPPPTGDGDGGEKDEL